MDCPPIVGPCASRVVAHPPNITGSPIYMSIRMEYTWDESPVLLECKWINKPELVGYELLQITCDSMNLIAMLGEIPTLFAWNWNLRLITPFLIY